jgi:FixJ family two-component response regulator
MLAGRVVVIDDDSSVRRALARLIRAAGYEVETLEDAQAYLDHRAIPPPACLVLDVRMPGMSGLELQTAIEGTPRSLPIVFITGHGEDDTRASALSAGAVDVLQKPLDEKVLFAAIERALARCGRDA